MLRSLTTSLAAGDENRSAHGMSVLVLRDHEARRAEEMRGIAPNDETLHPESVAIIGWEACFKEGTKTYDTSCGSSTNFRHDAGKSHKTQCLPSQQGQFVTLL